MKFGKLIRIFKKGSRVASARGKKGKEQGFQWPSGIRLGVYGHSNAGKTVYFTVLHEECKISRNLQISVTDHATATELLRHFRSVWGLSTTEGAGTAIDLEGERAFPELTEKDRLMLFSASLDHGRKMAVVSYDYSGKAVAISEAGELKEKVTDFMSGCDGILFLYDPKVLGNDIQNQAHLASFVNMIETLAPLDSRLPIPVALVVAKADILPGFSGDQQTVLVAPEDESWLSEDFDVFLERVLSSDQISRDPTWASSVRQVLVKLREFLKIVVGRTLDFQIFFVSATGQTPEKIGTDVGRSIYTPPRKITPVGVKEPVYWLLRSIRRNRRISRTRGLARVVATLALIWAVVYSVPHLYHLKYLLPNASRVEQNVLKVRGNNMFSTSKEERRDITTAYRRYENSWTVKWIFPSFVSRSRIIREAYQTFSLGEAVKQLDLVINRFASMVSDTALWPHVNPSDSSLITSDQHEKLVADLDTYHQGDSGSVLFTRSGRALQYWELFTRAITVPGDTTFWNVMTRQIDQDRSLYPKEISQAEQNLTDALKAHEIRKAKKVIAKATAYQLDEGMIASINGNSDPKYRLRDAVRELQSVLSRLDPSDIEHRNMINDYLKEAGKWSRVRGFKCKIETLPGQDHLHIEVTDDGKDPKWAELNQLFEGDELTIQWKVGQDIHIALDTAKHPCQRGKQPSDKIVLSDKYALFDMEKSLSFDNVGKKVTVRFLPSLSDRLPVLK